MLQEHERLIIMLEKGLDKQQSSEFIKTLIQRQLRKKLQELSSNMDCSLEQLSRLSGIGFSNLSAMIEGKEEITPNVLVRILDVFNYFAEETILYKQKIC